MLPSVFVIGLCLNACLCLCFLVFGLSGFCLWVVRVVWVGGVGGFGFSANLRSYLMLVFGSCLWVFWLACLAIAFEMVGCFAGLLPLVVVWISGFSAVNSVVLFCYCAVVFGHGL